MNSNTTGLNQSLRILFTIGTLSAMTWMSSCDDEDPVREDVPELITKATLTFAPEDGGPEIVVTATDPDGDGVKDIAVDGPINLIANKTYTLHLTLVNGLANPGDPAYDITAEVEAEGDEHLFFFAWTNNVFNDPAGDGNMDNRTDIVNYIDEDAGGLPLGLYTVWTATASPSTGTFRVLLKHQPGLKSATSSSTSGETDLDITFTINIL